jgi:hypothetical protein
MSRTILFYNVILTRNGNKTNASLVDLIDRIITVDWCNRLRRINGNPTGIFDLHVPNGLHDSRIIALGKFRQDYKPFIGHVSTQRLEAIRSDIVEMVTILAVARYQLVVTEYNLYGLRYRGIEEYFNSFLPVVEGEKWEVNLIPIYSRRGIEDIERSEQVRFLEMKLNLSNIMQDLWVNGAQNVDDNRTLFGLFTNIPNVNDELDAQSVRIEFNSGQGRNQTLNLNTVMHILHMLNIDNEAIDSLKVRFRDSRSNRLDTINLKNSGGQLKDKILDNDSLRNPSWEYIGNQMLTKFFDNEGLIYEAFLEHIGEQVSANIPDIVIEPPDECRVNVDR